MKPTFFACLLITLICGCQFFDIKRVSSKDIELASSWNDADQAPNFSECESIEDSEHQKTCFETIISDAILNYIKQNPLESSVPLQQEVHLTLRIDNKGAFSLERVNFSDDLKEAIPNLEETLQTAVSYIPKAFPAVKTNVGVFVATEFTLPIMIYTH